MNESTEPVPRLSNMAQVQKKVFDFVLNPPDPTKNDSAWSIFRNDHLDDLDQIFGSMSSSKKRETIDDIESKWKATLAEAKWRGPLAMAYLKISTDEMSLIGEILACLDELELENPGDVRDAVGFNKQLQGQQVRDYTILNAIEFLETAEHTGAPALREKYNTLYPPEEPDDEPDTAADTGPSDDTSPDAG